MSSCPHCKQVKPYRRVHCNGCKRSIHLKCLSKFIASHKALECCLRNLSSFTVSTTSSTVVASRIDDQAASRSFVHDSNRGVDLNSSTSSAGSVTLDSSLAN